MNRPFKGKVMAVVDVFQNQREFRCNHCSGKILVPKDLPPMTGPCPHCSSTITSPGPESDADVSQRVSAKIEVPAVIVHEPAHPEVRKSSGPPPLPPIRSTTLPVARSAEPAGSPFHDRSAVAVAEAPAVGDLTAGKLAEAERALAVERARSEAMAAAVAAEQSIFDKILSQRPAEKAGEEEGEVEPSDGTEYLAKPRGKCVCAAAAACRARLAMPSPACWSAPRDSSSVLHPAMPLLTRRCPHAAAHLPLPPPAAHDDSMPCTRVAWLSLSPFSLPVPRPPSSCDESAHHIVSHPPLMGRASLL